MTCLKYLYHMLINMLNGDFLMGRETCTPNSEGGAQQDTRGRVIP